MKKTMKTLALCLAVLIAVPLIPAAPATAARPRTLDNSRIEYERDRHQTYLLKIGEMSFRGKTVNLHAPSEEDIDKMIDDTLKEMGLTANEFDALNELLKQLEKIERDEGPDEKEWREIKDNLWDILGVGLGPVASLLQLIDQLTDGEWWGAGQSTGEGLLDVLLQAADKTPALKDTIRIKVVSAGFSVFTYFKALRALYQSWERYTKRWETIRGGMQARMKIQEFYKRLEEKLKADSQRRSQDIVILFKDVKSEKKPFWFEDSDNLWETWTLNAEFHPAGGTSDFTTLSYSSRYEANFRIDIEYDIVNLPHAIYDAIKYGVEVVGRAPDADVMANKVVMIGLGEKSAKRTMEGTATILIERKNGKGTSSIRQVMSTDTKDVKVSNIYFQIKYDALYFPKDIYPGYHEVYTQDAIFSADEETFSHQNKNVMHIIDGVVVSGPEDYPLERGRTGFYWWGLRDGRYYIWGRGDSAKESYNWTLQVTNSWW